MSSPDTLSNFTTTRPVAVTMVFLAAVVFGYFSYQRLPLTLMPELSYPTLTVRTEYAGAAPEEVENDISRPIEEALGVVGGLHKISSVSRSGVSDVVLEFVWGTKMSEATQNVLEKLDLVFLPKDAKRPLILHFDPTLDPVLELSFSGKGDTFEGEQGLRRLRRIAELQIKRVLEPIKGVAAVRIRGGLEEEIHVLLDESELRRSNLSIETVIKRLAEENINLAGGTIVEGRTEYMVRTLNEFESLDQIRQTILTKIDDRVVRVSDVGQVIMGHKEREISTRSSGDESVSIEIYKEADANIVSLAKLIKARVGTIQIEAPEKESEGNKAGKAGGRRGNHGRGGPGVRGSGGKGPSAITELGLAQQLYDGEGATLKIVADRSLFIEGSIREVGTTAWQGGVLAVIILFLFLRNLKSTLIIGISIPVSLLVTFVPLNLSGVSLNIMSLGGLALGVGMLVDSSIVVLESIYRCMEEGDDFVAAAIRGTAEVRGAVVASTLTTIAVFFPMVFVEGIAGQIFGDLGLAVINSLLASLIVALFLIPMLASRGKANLATAGEDPSRIRFTPWFEFAEIFQLKRWKVLLGFPYFILRFLFSTLFWLIGLLFRVILIAFAFVALRLLAPVLAFLLKLVSWLPFRFMDGFMGALDRFYPPLIRWALRSKLLILAAVLACLFFTWFLGKNLKSELLPEIHQGEFTIEASLPVGTPLEQTILTLEPVERAILAEREHIKELLVTFGYDVTNTKRSDEGEHSAKFKVLLEPSPDNMRLEEEVIARLRAKFTNLPDLELRVTRPVLFSATTPIEVEIYGTKLDDLKQLSEQIQLKMSALPLLSDVESSLKSGAPEIQVRYDRERIMRYGLNLQQVANLVKSKVKGDEATRFNMKDRRVPVLTRLKEEDRASVEDVGRMNVSPNSEHPIPLETVADISLDEGPSEVRRIDGSRAAVLSANLASGSLSDAVAELEQTLSKVAWPEDCSYKITGQNQEWQRSRNSLFLALFLSIFLVYVIMASQFESLLYPLVIMFTIPLAFFGSVVGLSLLGISLSIIVFLGMILLAGIVVNNAIVLVDYINTLKARGLEREEAIITAGSVRLRPILMTTATTVLGLLPMAFGMGDGAEIRSPLAVTVIFGLVVSTILTLVIIPSIYALLDDFKARIMGTPHCTKPVHASHGGIATEEAR